MTAEDRALGSAIRRRRTAMGLQQREVAEQAGLASVVFGRVELGTRPARATELRDIARTLGTTADDLLRGATPIPPEEVVERAVAMRDTAYRSLLEYGSAVVDAIAAVGDSDGAHMDGTDITDADGVAAYLQRMPHFDGLTVPADLVDVLRTVIDGLAASVPVYTRQEKADG